MKNQTEGILKKIKTAQIILYVMVVLFIYDFLRLTIKHSFPIYYFFTSNLLWIISISIIFLYIFKLEKSLKNSFVTKNLKNLEYLSYLAVAYIIWTTLFSFLFIYLNPDNSVIRNGLTNQIYFLVWLTLKVTLVIFLFQIYQNRKITLGSYKKLLSNSPDFNFNYKPINQIYYSEKERIELCKTCSLRTFNRDIGTICSLTNKKPIFETTCSEYTLDNNELKRLKKLYPSKEKKGFFGSWLSGVIMAILGFVRAGIRGLEDPMGIVFLCLGFMWILTILFRQDD